MSNADQTSTEAMRLHRLHCPGCGECQHVGQVMHITDRGHRQLDRIEQRLGEERQWLHYPERIQPERLAQMRAAEDAKFLREMETRLGTDTGSMGFVDADVDRMANEGGPPAQELCGRGNLDRRCRLPTGHSGLHSS